MKLYNVMALYIRIIMNNIQAIYIYYINILTGKGGIVMRTGNNGSSLINYK